jgi:predicted metal-dependent phosphoesterase TrpH
MICKADLHVHSLASPDGRSTLGALAREARRRGLDALAVTDHNLCTAPPEQADVLFIPGTEISTAGGHVLGLFLERPTELPAEPLPTAEAAVREIRRCGGLAVIAHPFESEKADRAALETLPLDGVECANARAAMKRRTANDEARALAARRGLPQTGGSDAHGADELAACWTELDAGACTLPELRAALAAGRSRAVFVRDCRWVQKGKSQLTKARRSGGLKKRLRACVYFAVCVFRDLRFRKER